MIMRAAKVDNNHKQIVSDLRKLGYSVRSIAQLKNACDLMVFDGNRIELFEVKSPETCRGIEKLSQHDRERFLTDGESEFASHFRVWIVVSAEEIEKIFKTKRL